MRVVALLFAELTLVVFGLCYCVAGYLLDVRSLILRCALCLMPCLSCLRLAVVCWFGLLWVVFLCSFVFVSVWCFGVVFCVHVRSCVSVGFGGLLVYFDFRLIVLA